MVRVIDVDKLMAWITANQRDEAIPSLSSDVQPIVQPAPIIVSQSTVALAPSGPLGSKTNPIKLNKTTSQVFNGFIPENSPNDSKGTLYVPATSKVYYEVNPIWAFKLFVKFYAGAGVVCKLTQDKITGEYSSEVCQGSDSFMDIVMNPSINKKYLYAIDNSLSPAAANDEMWVQMPFNP